MHAGRLGSDAASIVPPPESWAASPSNDVAAVIIDLPAGGAAAYTVPPAHGGSEINRNVYIVEGANVSIAGRDFAGAAALKVRADAPLEIRNKHATLPAQVRKNL
jgi:quercetin 2,3-dioxygenase